MVKSHFSLSGSWFKLLKSSLTMISILVIYMKSLSAKSLIPPSSWTITQELVKILVLVFIYLKKTEIISYSDLIFYLTSPAMIICCLGCINCLFRSDLMQSQYIKLTLIIQRKKFFWNILMWDCEKKKNIYIGKKNECLHSDNSVSLL